MSEQKNILELAPHEMVAELMTVASTLNAWFMSDGVTTTGEPESESKFLTDRELILGLLRSNAIMLAFLSWTVAQQQRRVVPAAVTNGARNLKVVL